MPWLAPVFQLGRAGPLDNIALIVTSLAVTLLAAALSYRFIERPMIIRFGKLRERLFHRKPEQASAG